MQHLIDHSNSFIEFCHNKPILAFFITIVGVGTGYSAEEWHLPLWLMQCFQIFAWCGAGIAGIAALLGLIEKYVKPFFKNEG